MLAALSILALLASPQATDTTLPPAGAHTALVAEGRGVQIYRCTQQGSAFAWVLVGPEAKLLDPASRQQLGTHQAGPSWTWKDGSSISGKPIQKSPSPDASSIPWLLLQATPSGTPGALSKITLVRRSDTHGGNASSTGCDATHSGQTARIPYTATYTFYTGQ